MLRRLYYLCSVYIPIFRVSSRFVKSADDMDSFDLPMTFGKKVKGSSNNLTAKVAKTRREDPVSSPSIFHREQYIDAFSGSSVISSEI